MTRYADAHSIVVAWLKVLLPLVALGILSTLFLVSRRIDPNDAIPYSTVNIEDRIREPRLTAPTWSGVTDDGSALTISAAEARPGKAGKTGAKAAAIVARLATPAGASVDMTADQGALDERGEKLTVSGDVVITTSNGYRITADAMTAALNRTSLLSDGPVTAIGPAGQIESGAMELTKGQSGDGGYLLVFNKGVKLLYQPPK